MNMIPPKPASVARSLFVASKGKQMTPPNSFVQKYGSQNHQDEQDQKWDRQVETCGFGQKRDIQFASCQLSKSFHLIAKSHRLIRRNKARYSAIDEQTTQRNDEGL
jgi:hypothetical protein